jgi:hypothetical protein
MDGWIEIMIMITLMWIVWLASIVGWIVFCFCYETR